MEVTFKNYGAHQSSCEKALDIAIENKAPSVSVQMPDCQVLIHRTDAGNYIVQCIEDSPGFKQGIFAKGSV